MNGFISKGRAAVLAAAIAGVGLMGCGGGGGGSDDGPNLVRATEYGQVEGVTESDTAALSWRGVPFAKAPVGPLRWQPTQAPDAWTGVRPAKEFTEACTQIGGLFGPAPKGKDYSAVWETFYKPIGSEDCLYLNIWSPAADATKLPVIVFIHGGSNVVGASFDPLTVGGNLAKNANAVVVTVAYRLGVMGWFAHPAFNTGDPLRDSGNFALLDLIQSLKFVKNNIANFGGDPGNVTIMGQSAGSTNVNALIVSPLATGLFHKAVSLSGGVGGSAPAAAVNKANAFINALLIKDRLATDKASADAYRNAQTSGWIRNYVMSKSAADLYNIQVDPTGGKWGTGSRTFEPGSTSATLWSTVAPILDGTVMPANATTAIRNGNFSKVPQLVGNTAEEGKLFSSAFRVDDYTRVKWMNGTYLGTTSGLKLEDVVDASIVSPLTPENYDIYTFNNANRVSPAPSITTATFWALSNSSNTAYYPQVPIYAYDFKWNEEPAPWNQVYGAWHTGDLAFIFGNFTLNLQAFGWSKANEPGRLALSKLMQQSLAAFVRTGDPNTPALGVKWEQWTPTAPRRVAFDASLTQASVTEE
ncbi:carboxylesterase/lipase family protein [Piscinibacter koreensis]|uniref:Carboxylic ester hydrolase n=1 Tax=Piscinibacter koreensis TaxID=2742824 RepID=A0A7Y6TVT9_9BURK|nr:carboxylesterase family protein [Schlegelella koreensis]NUZ05286.1 carboxylesterase family protein [Schlegelella koreensis]